MFSPAKAGRLAGASLTLLAALSCGTTGGALVTLPFQAGGVERAAAGPMTFTTPTGWTVTLQTALIALGPFYFNSSTTDSMNFRSGIVIIEATEQVVVDCLNPALQAVPGGADGETGVAIAAEIDLFPPDATQTEMNRALLGQNVGLVAGTATKGASTLSFSGPIVINQSLVTATTPLLALERVNGADVSLQFTAAPQTLSLRVDPTGWFAQTDFAQLLSSGPGVSVSGGVYTWDATSTFLNQLDQGVKTQSGIYAFSLAP